MAHSKEVGINIGPGRIACMGRQTAPCIYEADHGLGPSDKSGVSLVRGQWKSENICAGLGDTLPEVPSQAGGYFASRGLNSTEAEDLAHDVFQEIGRGKVPEDPNTYIYAIARNILSKHRQRKMAEHAALDEYRRRVTAANGHFASHILDAGASGEAPSVEAERILGTAIAKLPPKDAELVALRFIQGLPVRRVARRMSCSEDAVRKRIERLRAVLRRLYRE